MAQHAEQDPDPKDDCPMASKAARLMLSHTRLRISSAQISSKLITPPREFFYHTHDRRKIIQLMPGNVTANLPKERKADRKESANFI